MRVVHRIEAPLGQERQVAPIGGKGGVGIDEPPVGDVADLPVRQPGEAEPPEVSRHWLRPGQPGRVRREGHIGDRAVVGPRQLRDLSRCDVDQMQPPITRGSRDHRAVWRRGEIRDPSDLVSGKAAQRFARRGSLSWSYLKRVAAVNLDHPHDLARITEDPGQPCDRAWYWRQGPCRAFPVGQPVHRAAYLDGARLTGRVAAQARGPVQVVLGGDQFRGPPRCRCAEADIQPDRLAVGAEVGEEPDVAGVLVDDPAAVGARVARVHAVVIGVTTQVRPIKRAGVDIAGAFEIADERQPAGDQHRVGELAGQIGKQPAEARLGSAGLRLAHPEPAGSAAAVPLPERRVLVAGGQQRDHALVHCDVAYRPERQPALLGEVAGPVGHRDRICPGEMLERLVGGGRRQDLA